MNNTSLKVKKILINKFRRFENVEFELGPRITLIAGQNGTSKSTLLGMIAQPFSFGIFTGNKAHTANISEYTNNYHGLVLSNYKDLMGHSFNYDCKDVFRLSKKHDSDPEQYSYKIFLEGSCVDRTKTNIYSDGLLVRAQKRPNEPKVRFVAGPGKSSEKGEGNFPHPVVYIGLGRHWPLALAQKMDIQNEFSMDENAKKWFIHNYGRILLLVEPGNETEFVRVDGNKKGFVGISAKDYHSESFSAGQDNLVQILTAILSFRKLKEELQEKYQGGLILIDEIDSTLHAKAQAKLMEVLLEACDEYNLQIVGTTHSLYLLKMAFNSKQAKSIKTIYLERADNKVRDAGYGSFEEIELNLESRAIAPQKSQQNIKENKVSVVLEDQTAQNLFYSIFGRKLDKYVKRFTSPHEKFKSMSSSYLVKILPLVEKIPELKRVILMPDGDKLEDVKKITKKSENIVCLPGDSYLEKIVFDFLKGLSDKDPFWKKCPGMGYNKQIAIVEPEYDRKIDSTANSEEDKKWHKRWYKDQSKYWGRGNRIVLEAWAEKEKKLCLAFCKSFFKALKKISSQTIPTKIEDQIISKFQ